MKPLAQIITTLALASGLAFGQQQVTGLQFIRLMNVETCEHMYTTSQAEAGRLNNENGGRTWKIEGITGWVFPKPVAGTTPLYRLYRRFRNQDDHLLEDHFLTTHFEEANKARRVDGFEYEGIAGYVATSEMTGTMPLLRFSDPKCGHFYTADPKEGSRAVKMGGYTAEGQEGYVWTGPASLTAVPPPATVHRRIAGAAYLAFDSKDPKDRYSVAKGYVCVMHNPDCGRVGNSGEDRFFSGLKQLPIGAKVVHIYYTVYWPKGLNRSDPGGIGREGSYGQHLHAGTLEPVSVSWENSCYGDYSGKNLYYTISFQISMPVGTDLGEETYEPTPDATLPTCAPSNYESAASR